jgi:hypothetical protein
VTAIQVRGHESDVVIGEAAGARDIEKRLSASGGDGPICRDHFNKHQERVFGAEIHQQNIRKEPIRGDRQSDGFSQRFVSLDYFVPTLAQEDHTGVSEESF